MCKWTPALINIKHIASPDVNTQQVWPATLILPSATVRAPSVNSCNPTRLLFVSFTRRMPVHSYSANSQLVARRAHPAALELVGEIASRIREASERHSCQGCAHTRSIEATPGEAAVQIVTAAPSFSEAVYPLSGCSPMRLSKRIPGRRLFGRALLFAAAVESSVRKRAVFEFWKRARAALSI